MRKINKPAQVPQKLLDKQTEIEADLINEKTKFKFTAKHHSAPIYEDLKTVYHEKCAYCENKLVFSGDFDNRLSVEHYRPKSVYWWLYLEWTNLFPICKNPCNHAKADNFIIDGTQATAPFLASGGLDWAKCVVSDAALQNEEPNLLHPDIDNGADYFYFKPNGHIDIKDNLSKRMQVRGISMFVILNHRTHIDNRRAEIDQWQTDFERLLNDFLEKYPNEYSPKDIENHFANFFVELINSCAPEKKYSLLFESMLYYFDAFFLDKLNPKQKNLALEAIEILLTT